MLINQTKEIIKKYQFHHKKLLGQNFLINQHILHQIIIESKINKNTNVVEIGTGLGTLTEALAQNAKKVISFEVDLSLKKIIEENLAQYKNVAIYYQDFLKVDLANLLSTNFLDEDVVVVANLPYYITSPIIFKILEETQIKKALIMIQKEVAKRLTGKPKTKDYNALSVYMEYKTKAKIVGNVSKNSFYPAPDVDSALLYFERIQHDYRANNEFKFLKFIRDIFSMRRKTLVNNIEDTYRLTKQQIEQILDDLGFLRNVRSEELSLIDIIKIYQKIEDENDY